MLKDEGLREPPKDYVVFPPVVDEQRKRLYNVFDRSIDVFRKRLRPGIMTRISRPADQTK